MSKLLKYPPKVKLFFALIFFDTEIFNNTKKLLQKKFGTIDTESEHFNFSVFTNYYEKEMGKNLKKAFISFEDLINPEEIVSIKLFSIDIESIFQKENKRQINIDPGYLTLSNVLLSTTKNHQHRIYLGKGIYIENTLKFTKKQFLPWEWTYPDYRTEICRTYFEKLRKIYKTQLNQCSF